jgi:hypothetical protein
MHEDWLVQVLREMEGFAKANNMASLFPLIEAGYEAARRELKLSAPIPLGRSQVAEGAIGVSCSLITLSRAGFMGG